MMGEEKPCRQYDFFSFFLSFVFPVLAIRSSTRNRRMHRSAVLIRRMINGPEEENADCEIDFWGRNYLQRVGAGDNKGRLVAAVSCLTLFFFFTFHRPRVQFSGAQHRYMGSEKSSQSHRLLPDERDNGGRGSSRGGKEPRRRQRTR